MNKKVWWLVAAGALAYLILKPKTAKAAEKEAQKQLPSVPPEEPIARPNAPTGEKFTDPATGQTLVGPSAPISSGQKYRVQRGESWSNIASRVYGDYRWWPWLWDVNRDGGTKYTNPEMLAVGDVIELPVTPPADASFKVAIFKRAKTHAEWYAANKKRARPLPFPKSVSEITEERIA